MRGLFITGTDTGVGKTWVTSLLVRELLAASVSVGACKPVCSGATLDSMTSPPRWEDVDTLHAALNGKFSRELICPQTFDAPLSPPAAAELEGKTVDPELLRSAITRWHNEVDLLLVEGAGGFLSPLTHNETNADLAADIGFPILVVATNQLGAINHTLLTLEAIRNRGMDVLGVVLNNNVTKTDEPSATSDRMRSTNVEDIARFGGVEVLTTLNQGEASHSGLRSRIQQLLRESTCDSQ